MSALPMENRVGRLEGAFEQVNERLGDIRRGFDSICRRFEGLEHRIEGLDAKFDRKFDSFQWRITSLILVTWVTTILTVLFHK